MSFKFELDRLTDYSTTDIVSEIRRVADLLAITPLKKREFDKESKVHSSTVIRRFGSWKAGLEAARYGHLYGGGPVTEKMRVQKGRDLTDHDLLEELRRIAQTVGRSDLTVDDIKSHGVVGEGIFRKRFGTTRNAIERAGLNVRPQGRRYTNDECFENLYEVWRHYGRRPSFSEINCPPSKVGGEAYIRRFGTWMKALAAFVERVNAEPDGASQNTLESVQCNVGRGNRYDAGDQLTLSQGAKFLPAGFFCERDRGARALAQIPEIIEKIASFFDFLILKIALRPVSETRSITVNHLFRTALIVAFRTPVSPVQ
jgi:hypothetical protein